jgi:hypothetical protein
VRDDEDNADGDVGDGVPAEGGTSEYGVNDCDKKKG